MCAEKLLNSTVQQSTRSVEIQHKQQQQKNLYSLFLMYMSLQLGLPTKHITLVPTY